MSRQLQARPLTRVVGWYGLGRKPGVVHWALGILPVIDQRFFPLSGANPSVAGLNWKIGPTSPAQT
jgi:hypothetical protein